ncbi:MAG: O-antigen ligase family protein [Rhodocyclaceae bacterium]|nr:O-antigen ligase family protein [Rhodocyclaceae bacterium]
MLEVGSTLALMLAAIVGAFACVVTVVGAVQLTAHRKHGYFHLVIPAILITTAVAMALSGRSMDFNGAEAVDGALKSPATAWVQRLCTLVILTVSAERIISHFSQQRPLLGAAPMLTLGFIAFWMGSIASPMFFSSHPAIVRESFYTLPIGLAALLLSAEEGEATLLSARDSIFIFQLVSYLVLPVLPQVVLDTNYTQGLIPGLPRFAGLAPHAVILAMLAQASLLCLWARPYANRHLNAAAWLLGLLTLILAQSKTAWFSFAVCALVMYLYRHGAALKLKLADPQRPQLGIAIGVLILLGLAAVLAEALFGNADGRLAHFLRSDSGTQLTSLTGRDVIWAVAYSEWMRNPLFGYGPSFLDSAYRHSIGLLSATHGHNQYMDLLPRAGLVGAVPLTLYLVAMLGLAVRHAVASRGLTLALFIVLALRAVSEVPLTLSGYGAEFIGHLLILILLPVYSAMSRPQEDKTPFARNPLSRPSPQS